MSDQAVSRCFEYKPEVKRSTVVAAALGTAAVFGFFVLGPMRLRHGTSGLSVYADVLVWVGVLAVALLWVWLSTWTVRSVRVTSERIVIRSHLAGWWVRGRHLTRFDVRWDEVASVEDIVRAEATSDPGARRYLRIDDFVLYDSDLGSRGSSGRYAELVFAIRAAIGDRLVVRSYADKARMVRPRTGRRPDPRCLRRALPPRRRPLVATHAPRGEPRQPPVGRRGPHG